MFIIIEKQFKEWLSITIVEYQWQQNVWIYVLTLTFGRKKLSALTYFATYLGAQNSLKILTFSLLRLYGYVWATDKQLIETKFKRLRRLFKFLILINKRKYFISQLNKPKNSITEVLANDTNPINLLLDNIVKKY